MIDPETAFSLAGMLAMLGWAGLLLALFVKQTRPYAWTAAAILIPALLGVAYILLIQEGMRAAEGGGFGSIAEVRILFANDSALAAGWLHYLAFDLFVGSWIAREGLASNVPALLLVPCLALTFLFGPAGLLLFLILRFAFSRRLALEIK
ncbi:MAG TPA: ABA4-like family protein [Sphingomicrobium sp.]|nr:ABA4-like family protein [Sphingomicrobium sp.]